MVCFLVHTPAPVQLNDIAINRMPQLNENAELRRIQIQLRREIQKQYGEPKNPIAVEHAIASKNL